jgi:hypothetical protein
MELADKVLVWTKTISASSEMQYTQKCAIAQMRYWI